MVDGAQAAELLSEVGARAATAVTDPAPFEPGAISVPLPEGHEGRAAYDDVEAPQPGDPARTNSGPGPRTQLAPRTGAGTPPSAVAAPDASLLRTVALTFDDGPSPELNQILRDHLAAHGSAATFFFIGSSLPEAGEWCTATAADGHEVGSHSWSHPDLTGLAGDGLVSQLDRTQDAIAEHTGRGAFHMRPPYGAFDDRVDRTAGDHGLSVQIWSVDSNDWLHRDPDKNLEEITTHTHRGAILLMHEVHQESVDTVPQVLDWFEQTGMTMLTCSEIGQNQMYAGKHYRTGLVTHETPAPESEEDAAPSDGGG